MSYSEVSDHANMTHDTRRNSAYAQALSAVITPQTSVLDLGAGLGIHGLLAARLGARQIYMVEPEQILAAARQAALDNNLEGKITFLQNIIEQIVLPEKVDVIVSVFTGNFLLTEDLLPLLFRARDRWLIAGGTLIPNRAVMLAVPVSAPDLYDRFVGIWNRPAQGIDFASARSYAANSIYYAQEEIRAARYLADPVLLRDMNFYTEESAGCDVVTTAPILEDGICHGLAGWFQVQIGSQWLSTAPHDPRTHWRSAFLPVDPPLRLRAGETLTIRLLRPPFGEWTWSLETENEQRLHSTFWRTPLTVDMLRKSALEAVPQLSPQGELVRYIFNLMNGTIPVDAIISQVMATFPTQFVSSAEAQQFVQTLVKRYG